MAADRNSLTHSVEATVPQEMLAAPRWVAWRYEQRDGKPTKVPINPGSGKRASSTNPKTWGTLRQARIRAEVDHLAGVGFMLGDGFVGVDLDHCRSVETGAVESWAQAIIDAVDSYAEVSPRGAGAHIIAYGSIPTPEGKQGGRNKYETGEVEMYAGARFFTVTGQHLTGTPTTLMRRDSQLADLYRRIFPPSEAPAPAPARRVAAGLPDDDALIAEAKAANDGGKFSRLWDGDTSDYGGDESRADAALILKLAFWTDDDLAAIDRLFRRSGLMREKWDSRRGSSTYGQQTIDRALRRPHETRRPREAHSETRQHENGAAETASSVVVWRPNVQTARSIVEKEIAPARWAVRDLFTEGLNVLAGKPKRGKSTLLLHVESVVAKGGVALGKIHVQQGDALLLALEDNDRRMKERLMRQLGDDPSAPDRLYIEFTWPRLDQGGLLALDEWMNEHPETRIIGIDTFKRVKPATKSNSTPMYDADYDALQSLQAWAIARHVAVVALLHLRKQPAPEDPLDEISGSTGIVAAADNIVVMRQYNGVTSLIRKGRDYTDDEEWVLEGDAETLLWRISGDVAVMRVSRERQQLYDALKERPEGATPAQVAQRLGKSANGVRVMLYRAMQSGDEHIYKVDDRYLYRESNACNGSNGSNARNGSNGPITEPLRITRERNAGVMAADAANPEGFRTDAQTITPLLSLRGLNMADVACEHPANMLHTLKSGRTCGACGAHLDQASIG